MTLAAFQKARRKVQTRITPFKCKLGDENNNPYAGESGYYWVRRLDKADANGNVTPGTPFRVRSGTALVVPRGGREVWVGMGLDGHLTCLGFVHEDLTAPGVAIDPRAVQPNDPYRAWVRLKQIQNFRALPLATGNTDSLKVQVRQVFYYTEHGDIVRYNGTNASTHIDLTAYVPAANLQRYVVLWLRTYNPNGLSDIQVTYSSTISSIDAVLSFTQLQECADQADPDTIPIQAFRLADAQTTLTMDDTIDVDLRQFFNLPQVYGFPNDVQRAYRIHENHSVIMPDIVTISTGGGIQIQDGGVLVILDTTDETGTGGGASSEGAPTTATYLLQTANGSLPNAQAMGALATGLLKNTTATGVQSIAVAGTDYISPDYQRVKAVVRYATDTALPACTYANGTAGVGATLTATANGALTVDGGLASLDDRILVKNQSSSLQNGVYTVTQEGDLSTPFILTRAADADTSTKILGMIVGTGSGGVTNYDTLWYCDRLVLTVGTNPIVYAIAADAGSGLTRSGNSLAVTLRNTSATNHNIMVGTGITAAASLAPGTTRNVPVSNGTDFVSRALEEADLPSLPYLTGLPAIRRVDNATLYVTPGIIVVEDTLIDFTDTKALGMATAADWIGGSSLEANSEFANVYTDAAGNRLLYNALPNCPTPAAPVATMLVNQAGWNGTAASGLNATSIVYDGDTGEGSITAGMLLGVYTDSAYTTGRGRGSGAAGSRNNASFALITAVNTGTNTLTIEAGHNIAINDNDYLMVIPFGALIYRQVSGTWYRHIGMMYNDSSGNLVNERQADNASQVLSTGADITSTSATFADIHSSFELTVLCDSRPLMANWQATVRNTGGQSYFNLNVDAIDIEGNNGITYVSSAGATIPVAFNRLLYPLPGTHNLKPRWAVSAGTNVLANGSTQYIHPQFSVNLIG